MACVNMQDPQIQSSSGFSRISRFFASFTYGLRRPSPPQARNTITFKQNLQKFCLEDFQIIRTIGTGTFARVKLARHNSTQQILVLKVMKKQHLIQKRQVEHVNNERKILSRLDNPFVVKILGSFQDDRYIYMVQEYIPGGELYSHLKHNRYLCTYDAVFYAAEVASVFNYLHRRGLVYRDLKPENILITKDGHIKLVDFGFIKKLDENERTYTVCGTPEYLSPEVITQSGHEFATDWWTLGILLYEMLTGRVPFYDKNPYYIYHKIITKSLIFPSTIDEPIKECISKLLHKDPAHRLNFTKLTEQHLFSSINWSDVEELKLNPPYLPELKSDEDSSKFDSYFEKEESEAAPVIHNLFPDF